MAAFRSCAIGLGLCGAMLLPVAAEERPRLLSRHVAAEAERGGDPVQPGLGDRNLPDFITEPVRSADGDRDPSKEHGEQKAPAKKLPDWREAGTLFRWSFSDATGGPELDKPLVTDRPDFTEATSTVGRGVAQVEFGYAYFYDRDAGVSSRSQSFGEPLLRYGMIANWLEFRAALFPVEERIVDAGRRHGTAGTEDLYLGLKFGLTPKDGPLPEMAFIPQMTVPTGSPAFSNDQVLPGANLVYGWEVTEKFSTGGSTQFNRRLDGDTGRAYLEYAQSWTTGYKFTEKLGMYAEWFAFFPHSADAEKPQHYFNFGFAYLLSNDIQWDIRYGRGLNRAAVDYFVGTGLSIRFK